MLKAVIGGLGNWDLGIRKIGDWENIILISQYPNIQILITQLPDPRI
jgi:hypothetical protein